MAPCHASPLSEFPLQHLGRAGEGARLQGVKLWAFHHLTQVVKEHVGGGSEDPGGKDAVSRWLRSPLNP